MAERLGHDVPVFSLHVAAPLAQKALRAFEKMYDASSWRQARSADPAEQKELDQVATLMASGRASRTTVGYGYAWMRFVLWCEERAAAGQAWVKALPADELTCARYIGFLLFGGVWRSTGRVQEPLKPATVAGYCSAINHVHYLHGHGRPCNAVKAAEARKGGFALFGQPSSAAAGDGAGDYGPFWGAGGGHVAELDRVVRGRLVLHGQSLERHDSALQLGNAQELGAWARAGAGGVVRALVPEGA